MDKSLDYLGRAAWGAKEVLQKCMVLTDYSILSYCVHQTLPHLYLLEQFLSPQSKLNQYDVCNFISSTNQLLTTFNSIFVYSSLDILLKRRLIKSIVIRILKITWNVFTFKSGEPIGPDSVRCIVSMLLKANNINACIL